MTRKELAYEVARQMGCSKKEARQYVEAVLEGIRIGLERDEEVCLSSFGVFYVETKPAHEAKHPATGEIITVPERKYPKIRYSVTVKEMLNPKKKKK